MNRGVMVTRGDPDEKELEISARYVCNLLRSVDEAVVIYSYCLSFAEASVPIVKMTQ